MLVCVNRMSACALSNVFLRCQKHVSSLPRDICIQKETKGTGAKFEKESCEPRHFCAPKKKLSAFDGMESYILHPFPIRGSFKVSGSLHNVICLSPAHSPVSSLHIHMALSTTEGKEKVGHFYLENSFALLLGPTSWVDGVSGKGGK